jgi:uncharacterized protein (DUF1697 family)
MSRYVALLRGVSPVSARNKDLKLAFESAGFTDVKTVLSSGNVAFNAQAKSETGLARQAEDAMAQQLGRTFYTIVRAESALRSLVEADPFAAFDLPVGAKRIVTFLGELPEKELSLPIESEGARILAMNGSEIFTIYTPNPRGAVFMALIEKVFGRNVTTRTWETVQKCALA